MADWKSDLNGVESLEEAPESMDIFGEDENPEEFRTISTQLFDAKYDLIAGCHPCLPLAAFANCLLDAVTGRTELVIVIEPISLSLI